MALSAKVRERIYLWRDHVEKAAGPEQPIVVYQFGGGRVFKENPKQPYGRRK
jgi:hypothetical protein